MSKRQYQLLLALASAGLLAGCAADDGDATMGSSLALEYDESIEQAVHKICGTNSSFRGIDVSKWNSTVDWKKVANDSTYDVKFAIARVSDGLNYPDSQFDNNWQGIKEAGLIRGVYQFFRPSQDAVKQADYLLSKIGSKLEANDLPPVIDVEKDEDLSAAEVAKGVKAWINRVESVLGVKPIIYTGGYFWDSHVAISDFADYPLWHAAYPNTFNESSSCPSISNKWDNWTMWQYASNAHLDGIRNGEGDVDINVINGSLQDLINLTYGGGCGAIGPEGGIIDNQDSCFYGGGNASTLRTATDAGYNGDLRWSKTWVSDHVGNWGQWNLKFEQSGKYRLEAYQSQKYGELTALPYKVTHNGITDEVLIDQTGLDGWKTIGTFYFSTEGEQKVVVDDVVASKDIAGKMFVMDAIRLTPVALDEAPIDYTAACYPVPEDGRVIDETDGCFVGGGDAKWLRQVDSMGYDKHLIWSNTKTTVSTTATSTGTFNLSFDKAGEYVVSAYIPDAEVKALVSQASGKNICQSVQYDVKDGTAITAVTINQSSTNGWYDLGSFSFTTADGQYVQVKDTISDTTNGGKTFIIDAIKLARVEGETTIEIEDNTDQPDEEEYIAPVEDADNIEFENKDDTNEETNSRESFYDDSEETTDPTTTDNEPEEEKPLVADDYNDDQKEEEDNGNQGRVIVVSENPDEGTASSGCNSQAGDASIFSALFMAAALWFSRRKQLRN